jgi:NifB/MoaA-like Fe-S oxidoreductase
MYISIATGALAAPLLREWADGVSTENLDIRVHKVRNELFGHAVTVSGLMLGRDVADQLRNKKLGDVLFLPSVALRDDSFLDDVTVAELSSLLGCRVEVVEPLPYRLARRILEIASR